jgi:rubrerythrin
LETIQQEREAVARASATEAQLAEMWASIAVTEQRHVNEMDKLHGDLHKLLDGLQQTQASLQPALDHDESVDAEDSEDIDLYGDVEEARRQEHSHGTSHQGVVEVTGREKAAADLKDQMLRALLQERSTLLSNISQRASLEVAEWSKLVQQFAGNLEEFRASCTSCGVRLSLDAANGPCVGHEEGRHTFRRTNAPKSDPSSATRSTAVPSAGNHSTLSFSTSNFGSPAKRMRES